jgi:hypothetical protein
MGYKQLSLCQTRPHFDANLLFTGFEALILKVRFYGIVVLIGNFDPLILSNSEFFICQDIINPQGWRNEPEGPSQQHAFF